MFFITTIRLAAVVVLTLIQKNFARKFLKQLILQVSKMVRLGQKQARSKAMDIIADYILLKI